MDPRTGKLISSPGWWTFSTGRASDKGTLAFAARDVPISDTRDRQPGLRTVHGARLFFWLLLDIWKKPAALSLLARARARFDVKRLSTARNLTGVKSSGQTSWRWWDSPRSSLLMDRSAITRVTIAPRLSVTRTMRCPARWTSSCRLVYWLTKRIVDHQWFKDAYIARLVYGVKLLHDLLHL